MYTRLYSQKGIPMPRYCGKTLHLAKRPKRALEQGKPKLGSTVKQAAKIALKPKLIELEASFRKVQADFVIMQGSQARLLAELHPLIDFYRTRWVELANMRNRIQRSTR